jgi:hypothetical protein
VAYVLNRLVNQAKVDAAVERAAQSLAPDVVRIRYSFDDDWTGDPSIFFRVLISDEAAGRPKLSDLAEIVRSRLRNEVKTDELGIHAYFDYRSLSEQSELNEPEWA